MSLPCRQQRRLWRVRRTFALSEPRLASMLVMFTRLYAAEPMPAREQVHHRLTAPVSAFARAVWALIRFCGRVLLAVARCLRPSGRPLGPASRYLRRAAMRCLITCRFLPAGFRLGVGAWLMAQRPATKAPPAAHRRTR
jgi:hypothetical protein